MEGSFIRSLLPSPGDLLVVGGVLVGGFLLWQRYIAGSTSDRCISLEGIPKALCNLGADLLGDALSPEAQAGTTSGMNTWLCENLRTSYCFGKAQFPDYGGFSQSQYDLCMAASNECDNL